MSRPVIVIGAGGHAAVVADALLAAGVPVVGFTDADPARQGGQRLGLPVLGSDNVLAGYDAAKVDLANGLGFVRGPGLQSARARVQQALEANGWRFVGVRHPQSLVSRHAVLGPGTQVLAAAVVQAGATIGEGTIVNTAAIVEHGATVGRWCHLATRATLCGDARVGDGCLVGAGAVLRQSVALGQDATVGAGAVLVRDGAPGDVLCGVPARSIRTKP